MSANDLRLATIAGAGDATPWLAARSGMAAILLLAGELVRSRRGRYANCEGCSG